MGAMDRPTPEDELEALRAKWGSRGIEVTGPGSGGMSPSGVGRSTGGNGAAMDPMGYFGPGGRSSWDPQAADLRERQEKQRREEFEKRREKFEKRDAELQEQSRRLRVERERLELTRMAAIQIYAIGRPQVGATEAWDLARRFADAKPEDC